jgi:hypothetical protein
MDKKLQKYIDSYELIESCDSYKLIPNGGMILLLNYGVNCEVIIEEKSYLLETLQPILINAYEYSVCIKSDEKLHLKAVRFKGAGASFFYEEYMEELMHNPTEPIFIKEDIRNLDLNSYLKNRFKPSNLPFNIMKIIDLLDVQGSTFNIDEVLAIANVPRKILDKMFRLKAGLTFKTYASIVEVTK